MFYNALGENLKCPVIRYKSQSNPHGPKVLLTCLNHGDEVIGLDTAYQILDFIKANDELFYGEVVVFTALNYDGFVRSSRFFEAEHFNGTTIPNLNRQWPGANSSFAETWAKHIFQQILAEKPDYVFDLHSYAKNSLIHAILDRPGGTLEDNLINISKQTQIPFYLEYEAETFTAQKLDKSLSNQLCILGIPSLTIELGPKQGFNLIESHMAITAMINLFIATKSLISVSITDLFEIQHTELDRDKLYFREGLYNKSAHFGFYRPLVNIGKIIKQGEVVAEILNLQAEIVHKIHMPKDGFIIAMEDIAVVYPHKQFGVFICDNPTSLHS